MTFGFAKAQMSFQIAPIINKKIYVSSALLPAFFHGGFNYSNQFASNPYFTFNNQPLSSRPEILLGLSLKLNLDTCGRGFELSFSQDGIGSAANSSTLFLSDSSAESTKFENLLFYYRSAHAINRISASYQSRRFTYKQRQYPAFQFEGGVSMYFGRPNVYFPAEIDTLEQSSPIISGAYLEGLDWSSSYNGRATLMIETGINLEFGLNLKSKSIYLFNFNLSYRQGLETTQFSTYKFYINDAGQKIQLVYLTSSKGSGIYFELSRNFYLWKANK